jgi:hypothetical protein
MKEAAISAAALTGLLAFAGIYNRHAASRARRDVRDEMFARPGPIDDEFADNTQNFMNDVSNITADAWYQMQVGLGIPEQEILPFEVDEDDVQVKQKKGKGKKKRGKGASMASFKLKDIPILHEKMVQTHSFRVRTLLSNFVADAGVGLAERTPVELLDDITAAHAHVTDGHYPDYSGADKTAPSLQKFLDEFEYDDQGRHLFATGQNQMWFLIPAAVPLFGDADGHLSQYPEYWNHVSQWRNAFDASNRNLKLSIGLYHKGAVYSPKGTTYRGRNFPWTRVQGYYMRPRTTTSMPYIIPTADSLVSWIPRYGSSSAAAGQDCYAVWFHQDFAADANQLLLPEEFAKVDQLYQMCNVMHVFVGMDSSDGNVQAYASALIPGLQSRVAKDPEFSGAFFADNLADIATPEFMQGMFKYATLLKNRAGCRMTDSGYVPPASVGAPITGFPAGDAITFAAATAGAAAAAGTDAPLMAADATAAGTEAPADYNFDGTVAPTDRGLSGDLITSKVPEIDSCCGHDMFAGVPYDSELRTCCEDGQPQSFTEDGSDPCVVGDLGFEFRKK